MRKIFVVDPGMMEAGGHHAALLSTLTSYEEVASKNITLITHKQIDTSLVNIATNNKVKVVPHFSSNFYQHYGSTLGLKDPITQGYIRKLAIEYLSIFKWMASEENADSSSRLTFFYPCLNWEHAFALKLALAYADKQKVILGDNCIHKACCMFTSNNREEINHELLYRQSFIQLSRENGLQLYASDYETQAFYEQLDVPIIGIHPCYLLPWGQIEKAPTSKNVVPRILLYLGDAKENKGFNELPSLVERLLRHYNNKVTLVVQYTLAWEYPELKQSIIKLDELAKRYEQVEVHKKYWSSFRLVEELRNLDEIYCTYNSEAYKNKSSGLVWLASYFGIPVVLKDNSWLTREFARLAHHFSLVGNKGNHKQVTSSNTASVNYARSLFSNLLQWLES